MYLTTLGTPLRCSSTTAPALSYYRPSMDICIALLPAIHGSTCSFWKNISCPRINVFWLRFSLYRTKTFANTNSYKVKE